MGEGGEYGRETGRRARFQARLFETSLVVLSIPWVDGQSVGENSVLGWGEGCLSVRLRSDAVHLSLPNMEPSGSCYHAHNSNFL